MITTKVRTKLKIGKVKTATKLGALDALKRVGAVVQEKTRREMSNRSPLQNPKKWKVGTIQGSGESSGRRRDGRGRFLRDRSGPRDLVALVAQVPNPDRVTSWKTRRAPGGMLLRDIQFEMDRRKVSTVVGPSKIPSLNKLQEFGGATQFHFTPVPQPKGRSRKFQNPLYGVITNKKTRKTIYTFSRSLKARRFMEKGLAKSRARIPEQFRDRIYGPAS